MTFRFLKYLAVLIIPGLTASSFFVSGWLTYSTVIFSYLLVPALEFLFSKDESNLSDEEEALIAKSAFYDYVLYLMVPVQWGLIFIFLYKVSNQSIPALDLIGMTLSLGVCCGVLGINVAHELGHRKSKFDQFLAKTLLLTSSYMHFFIEHNRGHHKHVGTPGDPSTAKQGESVHLFWLRSIMYSYISAWQIANAQTRKTDLAFSIRNEMIQFTFVQVLFMVLVFAAFGPVALIGYLVASLIGIIQLETVNYIEHYGLTRNQTGENRYERVQPWHSWNSNHLLGRLMLFELSRHSDHHYLASRKYQILRHHHDSPQMPTGYPGMMLLSLFPPLWFRVMNPKIQEIKLSTL